MFASLRSFAYHEPHSLPEAIEMLAALGPDCRVLAGGCDLLPDLRRRRKSARAIVNLANVRELSGWSVDEGELRILPMTFLRTVERAACVRARWRALYDGIHSIASVQVKATGTLVGNLCVATPASDIAPPLMVLGARLRIASTAGVRSIPVQELFAGAKRHTLSPGEIVVEVRVPPQQPGTGTAFAKLTRTHADCAKLNVAALVVMRDGLCKEARITLGAVAATPVRAPEAEAVLVGHQPDAELIERAASSAAANIRPITDIRSTAEYRTHAARVLVGRVVRTAFDRALGDAS